MLAAFTKSHGFIAALLLLFVMGGCGTTIHESTFLQDFEPDAAAGVVVGEITDIAPIYSREGIGDFDPEAELRERLHVKLTENDLLATETTGAEPYVLRAQVTDYNPGSAGKRWLMPGYGATELSVQSTLYSGEAIVGSVFARRTVEAGGLYTIGAWRTVFDGVADDIVAELKTKLGV